MNVLFVRKAMAVKGVCKDRLFYEKKLALFNHVYSKP